MGLTLGVFLFITGACKIWLAAWSLHVRLHLKKHENRITLGMVRFGWDIDLWVAISDIILGVSLIWLSFFVGWSMA